VQSYTPAGHLGVRRQDTPVDMAAIGNEIRNGILWRSGR